MGQDVYVGIDVSKTELAVAVRPSGESFTLAYHRVGSSSWWVGRANCSPSWW